MPELILRLCVLFGWIKAFKMMKLYFNIAKDYKNFMFEDLNIHGSSETAGLFIVCMLGTVVLEAIKSLLFYSNIRMKQNAPVSTFKSRLTVHSGNSLLHAIDVFLAYLIMLAVMTYDAYVIVAVLLGSAVGYFIFGALNTVLRSRNVPNQNTSDYTGFDNPNVVDNELTCCRPS